MGPGARFDSDMAPGEDLLLARRGTAFFARLLNDLPDSALSADRAVPGLQRRHVVARIGLHAREMCKSIARIRSVGCSIGASDFAPNAIDEYATIPAHALRNLFRHSAIHLNVVWRDLTDAEWGMSDLKIQISDTPLERAKVIWSAALDLSAGIDSSVLPDQARALLTERKHL